MKVSRLRKYLAFDIKNDFACDLPPAEGIPVVCPACPGGGDGESVTVPAEKEKLAEVTAFLDRFLEARDCPAKAQMQLELVTEELFVNVASYAYGDGAGDFTLRLREKAGELTMEFVDSGFPWDPLRKPDPDITLSAQERGIGGLGIFLVKKNTDSQSYAYIDGKNVLTLTKKLF